MKKIYSGFAVLFLGAIFVLCSFLFTPFLLIYGIPLLIVGIVILINSGEDKIEERQDLNKRGVKK